jgi:haloacetate dehalogenase
MNEGLQYADINGIRIAYERQGRGYPLLLLHGFPRTHRVWSKVAPALASRFSVVMPDRRGYGDSERPPDAGAYTGEFMAQDAWELSHHLGWDQFLLIGHDRGAPDARRVAANHPDAVRGLMILDNPPQGVATGQRRDPRGRDWYLGFFLQRGVAEQIMGQNPALFFSLFLDRNPHLSPEEHDYYVQMFSRPGTVEAVLADYRASAEIDQPYWEEQFKSGRKLTVPLCVIWGSRGPAANAPVLDLWKQVADDVRGAAVADAAHYVQEEQPEATVKHIMQFADELGIP